MDNDFKISVDWIKYNKWIESTKSVKINDYLVRHSTKV